MSAQTAFNTVAEAAAAQSVEGVMELLHAGCDVNARDPDGNTALHWAAWFKLDSILTKLVDRNARPDIGNNSGETAVHWAAKSSNVHALDSMTRHDRALLSQRDCDGFTPFIISAQNDNAAIMEWMFLKGLSVEEQDDWGRTAVQWACYKGHRRTVQWLLSRSASIVHRDHEGMTAIHWAALKGHEQAAEMLLDVGAVHLLNVPDAAGDTPIALAMRKKNRYLVLCFHKCQLFQFLFGRPNISRNHFANLFVAFVAANILVFAFILAPGIAENNPMPVLYWSLLMCGALTLWVQNCFADPGWIQPQTIFPQNHLIGDDPARAFDADQPVESQMVHFDAIAQEVQAEAEEGDQGGSTDLTRLEFEQNKFNYQRQLITEVRKQLDEGDQFCAMGPGGSYSAYMAAAGTGGTELQPLMMGGALDGGCPSDSRHDQLDRAASVLRERERLTGEGIGRARVQQLLEQGCGEYLSLVERGEFKQVCFVCRARRTMRSHHCKECGRCVERLDHHCPWIDNCVGLGNQRSFYCFIVMLLVSILYFYYVVVLYACDTVFPGVARSSIQGFMEAVKSWSLGPELKPILVFMSSCFNLIWLAFVGALTVRHTGYMIVNITTYEVLVKPSHVQRRFPKSRGRFWFLQGCGLLSSMRHCLEYWTLNMQSDAADFLASSPQDSFVAPLDQGAAGAKQDVEHGSPPRYGELGGSGAMYQAARGRDGI